MWPLTSKGKKVESRQTLGTGWLLFFLTAKAASKALSCDLRVIEIYDEEYLDEIQQTVDNIAQQTKAWKVNSTKIE